jgi:hypothetical protein
MLRRKHLLQLITAMALLWGLMALPDAASACSCVDPGTAQQRKENNHAVFDGTVIAVKPSSLSIFQSGAKALKASFHVHEVWKGQVTPELTVLTAEGSDSCGAELKEGERYLIYASERNGKLETSLCSGNTLYSEAGEQLAEFGSGSVPPAPSEGLQAGESSLSGVAVWVSGIFVVIAASAFIVYRRRKSVKSKI